MPHFIDTHSHLYDEAFIPDFTEVVARAINAGVSGCILPDIDMSTYDSMIKCCDSLPDFTFPCIGLHPTSVGPNWKDEIAFIKEHIGDRDFYAIGEIGLDEYWSKDFVDLQKRVFAEQIEIASQHDLPIIIHSREATEDIFRVLEETKGIPIKGVFHAFSGSYETFKQIMKYGDFKIGIGGVLTYKNAGIASVLEKISLSDILLETDCPWLTPVPYRGKRNETSYISIVAERVSQIKKITVEEVSSTTMQSSKQLFKLPDSIYSI